MIATDHESGDGTTDILEAYARDRVLLRIAASGPVRDDVWRTRMARLAATDHAADWILNTDADEFWWARGATLKEVLESVPSRFGAVGSMNRHFVPVADDGSPFFERMTVRVSPPASINDPTSPWRPGSKVAHRAASDVTVFHAGYAVVGATLHAVPDWYPFDMLHFPYRGLEQWVRKTTRRAYGDKSLGTYLRGHAAHEQARVDDVYGAVAVDEATVAQGLAEGSLVRDTRLRDVLRGLAYENARPAPPAQLLQQRAVGGSSPVSPELHDGSMTDLTALQDATLVRLRRRVDAVALRVRALETRGPRSTHP